jgi:1,4-dihydroxy-2-naphthoate octaprenyltransferase
MVNVRMWGKALVRMPRVSENEWKELDVVARWLIVTRAAVLLMTLTSCIIGGGFAWRDQKLDLRLWIITTFGLLMAHATNNLLNDLTDHWKGTDKGNYFRTQYGVQPLEQGLLSKGAFYKYTAFTGALALAAGSYLLWERAGLVLTLFAAGAFFVLFYTWPLKYYGLGELAVIVVWGPLMVGGTYYVVTGGWDWRVALVGTIYALGPTQVIFGKHLDKLQIDSKKRIHTLPVVIGEAASRHSVTAIMIVQYLLVVYLMWTGYLSIVMALVFLSLGTFFKVIKVYGRPRPEEKPTRWMADVWPLWFAAWSFLHGARFGLFLCLGLLIDLVFPQVRAIKPF